MGSTLVTLDQPSGHQLPLPCRRKAHQVPHQAAGWRQVLVEISPYDPTRGRITYREAQRRHHRPPPGRQPTRWPQAAAESAALRCVQAVRSIRGLLALSLKSASTLPSNFRGCLRSNGVLKGVIRTDRGVSAWSSSGRRSSHGIFFGQGQTLLVSALSIEHGHREMPNAPREDKWRWERRIESMA